MAGKYPSFDEFFKDFDSNVTAEGEYKAKYLLYQILSSFFHEYGDLNTFFNYEASSEENYALYLELKKDERFKDVAKMFEDDYYYIVSEMESFDDGDPAWREVIVEDESSIKKNGIGTSWSWDKEGAVSHCAEEIGISVIYKAVRNPCDYAVNWFVTILVNLMARIEETEIRLKKCHTVEVVEILVQRDEKYVNVLEKPYIARL